MTSDQVTYGQMDALLKKLGFTRERLEPKWLCYRHSESGTEIILVEKKSKDAVRPTDVWSAKEHLTQKGLITEEELDNIFQNGTIPQQAYSAESKDH